MKTTKTTKPENVYMTLTGLPGARKKKTVARVVSTWQMAKEALKDGELAITAHAQYGCLTVYRDNKQEFRCTRQEVWGGVDMDARCFPASPDVELLGIRSCVVPLSVVLWLKRAFDKIWYAPKAPVYKTRYEYGFRSITSQDPQNEVNDRYNRAAFIDNRPTLLAEQECRDWVTVFPDKYVLVRRLISDWEVVK